jgi:hypothetical protein
VPRTARAAEQLIELLGSESDVVVNQATDDQNGWDYILEFPQDNSGHSPDTAPPALTCLAQVKSSTRSEKSYRLKLSNALRSAQHSLPCFVVKIYYAQDGKTVRQIACQHFWTDQIASSLREVRRAHELGAALHEKKFSFPLSQQEFVDRDALFQHIRSVVLAHPNYATTKREFAKNVGEARLAGEFKIKSENFSDLVDATIGIPKSVPISDFVARSVRFGIADKKPLDIPSDGVVTITPQPVAKCNVILRDPNSRDKVVLRGEVFAPAIKDLPPEHRRLRIATEVIDLIYSAGKLPIDFSGTMNARFEPTTKVSLAKLHEVSKIFCWLAAEGADFEVVSQGRAILAGKLNADDPADLRFWSLMEQTTSRLADFTQPFDHGDLRFCLNDFTGIEGKFKFSSLVTGESGNCRFTMDNECELTGSKYLLIPYSLKLGDFTLFVIVQHDILQMGRDGEAHTMQIGAGLLRKSAVLAGDISKNAPYMSGEIGSAQGMYYDNVLSLGFPGVAFG